MVKVRALKYSAMHSSREIHVHSILRSETEIACMCDVNKIASLCARREVFYARAISLFKNAARGEIL